MQAISRSTQMLSRELVQDSAKRSLMMWSRQISSRANKPLTTYLSTAHAKPSFTTPLWHRLWQIATLAGVAGYSYLLIRDNCQDDLLQPAFEYESHLKITDSNRLKKFDGPSAGRSQGGYVTDNHRVFHDKKVFSQESLIREMLVGNMLHTAYPEIFPEIFVAQTPKPDGKATFKLLSEVKPHAIEDHQQEKVTKNLEELMETSPVPDCPVENLGVTIAAHCLVGNSDTKLANIICTTQCYPIDFENAESQPLSTFGKESNIAKSMVENIAEYQKHRDLIAKVMNEDAHLDSCDPYHPLMDNKEILGNFRDWLETSIQQDINSGKLANFYQKIASLTDQQLDTVVNGIPFLHRNPEKKNQALLFLKEIRKEADIATTNH